MRWIILRNTEFSSAVALFLALAALACQETPKSSPKTGVGKGMSAEETSFKGHLGKAFSVKEITSIEGIFADPKAFEGKTLRVQGVVMSHCHHRLAWFGLRGNEKEKQTLRVMTAPDFLVPRDVKHGVTRAGAEGVVRLRSVPEAHAKHLAKEHGLFGGEPDKLSGPQYVVTLHASGAWFQ